MQGHNVLWLPGTDHAGIATQMVVERDLAARGLERQAMGREAFVEAVWAWKRQSGDRIEQQMLRLGASCDWSRARFTLDEGLSRAVREVFVRLYEQGRIYRGRYIVNWCPRCGTALSDLEVTHQPAAGKLYTVRYRLEGGGTLAVATTRPETILADVAVAVNPADARYQALIGRRVQVPLTERTVEIIADEIAQPDFGTGAVKITPGHDANDFAAGQRHHLPQLEVINDAGIMAAAAGAYAGMDRFAARERIVADLEAAGLLAATADHPIALGRCQRCATVIEPRISAQWFVQIAPLAAAAVAAVERGEIAFTPAASARTYFDWMANIHDWCISRQLWWGHRIPAWHCDACGQILVARQAPAACACGSPLRQDPDVLDTWFSSGLWPFSTMGWPEATADLRDFYPTSLLVTGFDILFFWVARMIMLGVHFTAQVPFRQVYIHALVRDAERQKMSKTKGNVIDPLVVTEKYGTDAVRFTLAAMAAPGTDIALSEERMQGYAAFANKIWNAARFIFLTLNQSGADARPAADAELQPQGAQLVDRWIFSRLRALAAELDRHLESFRFDLAADAVYHFFWDEFCDWYLELHKRRS
ncbi:MAG: valine--tRNA ligase, partial [Terriglobales bacterium]